MSEYKERYCPGCGMYKPYVGYWQRVESKGRFHYMKCPDCQNKSRKVTTGAIRPTHEH